MQFIFIHLRCLNFVKFIGPFWRNIKKMMFWGQKNDPKWPKFSENKNHQCFSILNASFCANVQTNTLTYVPAISVDNPILGLKMLHFTIKWTFHEKYILVMFFYSESSTLYRISNKAINWFKDRCKWHNFGPKIVPFGLN